MVGGVAEGLLGRFAGNSFKRSVWNCIVVNGMGDARPVRCQKCGRPLGYVTVLGRGVTSLSQSVQNVKIVAVCMECSEKKK